MAGHLSIETASIRFYPDGKSYQNRDDYNGVVSIKFLDDDTVELHLAHGEDGSNRLLEAVELIKPFGVTRYIAKRQAKKRMPRPWQVIACKNFEKTWLLDLNQHTGLL